MIKLVFVNESCQNSTFFKKVSENSTLSEYINKPRSKKVKKERALAYGALSHLLSRFYKIENFSLDFSEKPKLSGPENAPAFNISHTEGAVVVAITDEYGSVGVDIEGVMSKERADKISRRFLDKTGVICDTSPALFDKIELFNLYCSADELILEEVKNIKGANSDAESGKIRLLSKNEKKSTLSNFHSGDASADIAELKNRDKGLITQNPHLATERYTLLEAALKCDGGGFGSFERYSQIISECESVSFWASAFGIEYAISLCLKDEKSII